MLRDGEANQRSQFQFEIIKLNLIANGALIAFALNAPDEWTRALLACPLISLVLFSLWFHHGIAIRMDAPAPDPDAPRPAARPVLAFLRQASFSVSILGNFVLVPLVAVSIFQLTQSSWIVPVALGTLGVTGALYLAWFVMQYHKA